MDLMDLELKSDDGKEKVSDRNQEGFLIYSLLPYPLYYWNQISIYVCIQIRCII